MKTINQSKGLLIFIVLLTVIFQKAACQISSFPYLEDFEADDGGWIAQNNGAPNGWEYGTPTGFSLNSAHSGIKVWGTNLDGDYDNNATLYLESPEFDFSGMVTDPYFLISTAFIIENFYDGAYIEYSTDMGISWTVLGDLTAGQNWYNKTLSNGEGWSGSYPDWSVASIRLSGLADQSSVMLRIVFTSDDSVTREGILIDDIQIVSNFMDMKISAEENDILLTSEQSTINVDNIGTDITTPFSIQVEITKNLEVLHQESFQNITLMEGQSLALNPGYYFDEPGGYTLTATAQISDLIESNNGFAKKLIVISSGSTLPYTAGFESGVADWVTEDQVVNSWELGYPVGNVLNAPHTGLNSFVTNLDGNYYNNAVLELYSPLFDFSSANGSESFQFAINHELESGYDFAWVEFSTDLGESWSKLGTNLSGGNNWYNFVQGWTGNSAGWNTASHSLSFFSGEATVILKIVVSSDGIVAKEGLAVDDIFIGSLAAGVDLSINNSLLISSECEALSSSQEISINVINTGDQTINSFNASYDLGQGPVTETVNQTIEPGMTFLYTFNNKPDLSNPGTYNFQFSVSAAGDVNSANDELQQSVTNNGVVITNSTFSGISCSGTNDGSISVTAQGGNGPIVYSIDQGVTFSNSGSFSNLTSGTYTVLSTDGTCFKNTSFSIADPKITLNAAISFDETCNDAADGKITISATSSLPMEYSIDNGITYASQHEFLNLAADEYHVWIRNNSCTLDAGLKTVGSPQPVLLDNLVFSDQGLCFGDESGFIEITGTGPSSLTYSIDGGITFSENNRFENLAAGTFDVVIRSGNCLSEVNTIEIINLPDIATPNLSISNHNILESSANENHWFLNDVLIPTATGKTYIAEEVGSYTVIAIDGFCQSLSSLPVEVLITGLDDYLGAIELYPNPAGEVIYLRNNSGIKTNRAILRNSMGQVITEYNFNEATEVELELPQLQGGIYYLEFLSVNQRVLVRKIIKE